MFCCNSSGSLLSKEPLRSWCPLRPQEQGHSTPRGPWALSEYSCCKALSFKVQTSQLLQGRKCSKFKISAQCIGQYVETVSKQTKAGSPRVSCNLPTDQPLTAAGDEIFQYSLSWGRHPGISRHQPYSAILRQQDKLPLELGPGAFASSARHLRAVLRDHPNVCFALIMCPLWRISPKALRNCTWRLGRSHRLTSTTFHAHVGLRADPPGGAGALSHWRLRIAHMLWTPRETGGPGRSCL